MKRRNFIKTTSCVTVGALIPGSNLLHGAEEKQPDITYHPVEESNIKVDGNTMFVETKTLSAVLEKGLITSLKCKQTGREYIRKSATNHNALQLVYSNGTVNMNDDVSGNITARQISKNKAEFIFHTWNGDGILFVSTDDKTGDLIIEPSAYSSRPGLLACRWNVDNINESLDLIAPFYQGVKLKLDDPLLKNTRWKWPFSWEAGLVILQSDKGGFWVHTQDDKYRFKALQTGSEDPFMLGFDSEASGPIDNNLSAGGVAWRINTYSGDWHVPATQYKEWYWKTYDLQSEEKSVPYG